MNNKEKLVLNIIKRFNDNNQDVGYFFLHKISYLVDISYYSMYNKRYTNNIYIYKGLGPYNKNLKDTLTLLINKNCIYENVINDSKTETPIHLFYLQNNCNVEIDKDIVNILDRYVDKSYQEISDIVYSTKYMKTSYPGDRLF